MGDPYYVFFKLKELNREMIGNLLGILMRAKTQVTFRQIGDVRVKLSEVKNIDPYIDSFVQQKDFPVFRCDNQQIEFSLLILNKRYPFIKGGEIYFSISTWEEHLTFYDDPDFPDYDNPTLPSYEQAKASTQKSVSSFLNVLKVLCETLKPEYGWGGVGTTMESRGFDAKDFTRPIIIYGNEVAKEIGESKLRSLKVKSKIKCSDGSYILLIEGFDTYNEEVREKIKKHLFG